MLTRGRKLTERNKHLNLRKQTKQKDENKYKLISLRKGKINYAKKNNRKMLHLDLTNGVNFKDYS